MNIETHILVDAVIGLIERHALQSAALVTPDGTPLAWFAALIGKQPFHGVTFDGERFDCGSKLGFAQANFALACRNAEVGEELKGWARTIL